MPIYIKPTTLGNLNILLGNLYLVFHVSSTPFNKFGYSIIYWNGRPIWFA